VAIDGFAEVELNPPGPDQPKVTYDGVAVPDKVKVFPEQTGELLVTDVITGV